MLHIGAVLRVEPWLLETYLAVCRRSCFFRRLLVLLADGPLLTYLIDDVLDVARSYFIGCLQACVD